MAAPVAELLPPEGRVRGPRDDSEPRFDELAHELEVDEGVRGEEPIRAELLRVARPVDQIAGDGDSKLVARGELRAQLGELADEAVIE